MKAKIKTTGEILKVADYAVIAMESCDSYGNPLEYSPEAVELIDDTPAKDNIDWEQRRFELVKAAMQGLLSTHSPGLFDKKLLAVLSVDYADTVLAEYMKGGEK